MQAIEYLKRARNLLDKPENWTGDIYARKSSGVPTRINSPDACRWCLTGALIKVSDKNNGNEDDIELIDAICDMDDGFKDATKILYCALGHKYENFCSQSVMSSFVSNFNDADDTTHLDIIDLLDTAIDNINIASAF